MAPCRQIEPWWLTDVPQSEINQWEDSEHQQGALNKSYTWKQKWCRVFKLTITAKQRKTSDTCQLACVSQWLPDDRMETNAADYRSSPDRQIYWWRGWKYCHNSHLEQGHSGLLSRQGTDRPVRGQRFGLYFWISVICVFSWWLNFEWKAPKLKEKSSLLMSRPHPPNSNQFHLTWQS